MPSEDGDAGAACRGRCPERCPSWSRCQRGSLRRGGAPGSFPPGHGAIGDADHLHALGARRRLADATNGRVQPRAVAARGEDADALSPVTLHRSPTPIPLAWQLLGKPRMYHEDLFNGAAVGSHLRRALAGAMASSAGLTSHPWPRGILRGPSTNPRDKPVRPIDFTAS